MVIHKRKKNTRQRASWSHGWGAKKKHRGAGHRGGRGNAGTGKRADTKKPSIWAKHYFGKFGFVAKNVEKKDIIISIKDMEQTIDRLVEKGAAKKTTKGYDIDLGKAGYTKLLSQGTVTQSYTIKVKKASANAIEKIKEKNGEIMLESAEEEKKETKEAKDAAAEKKPKKASQA